MTFTSIRLLRLGDLVIAAATTLLAWQPEAADASATAPPRILELVLCFDSKLGEADWGAASYWQWW
jgi:hypothetical protein